MRLEMKKTFFARRGLWVYLLALAPAVLFLGRSIQVPIQQQRLVRMARGHLVPIQTLRSIEVGMTRDQLFKLAGAPYAKNSRSRPMGDRGRVVQRDFYRYTDGHADYYINLSDGEVISVYHYEPETLAEDSIIFATTFQYFYLRLAVFFGCVGIFINLFRGEMLDKSLHYYLLTPMRREVLVLGKYLSGLIATTIIFTTSTGLQIWAMLFKYNHAEVSTYLQTSGWHEITVYLAVTALACVGYGTIFLLGGLLFRNPIIPAAAVLVWESANLFLPVTLKQLSLIYYLQSLCPVGAPPDKNLPLALQLLISQMQPVNTAHAIAGILFLSLALLAVSAVRSRKLEINYSTD